MDDYETNDYYSALDDQPDQPADDTATADTSANTNDWGASPMFDEPAYDEATYHDPFVDWLDDRGKIQDAASVAGGWLGDINHAIVAPNDSYKQATQAAGVENATDYLGILGANEPGQQVTNWLEQQGVPGHEDLGFEVGPVQVGPRELIGFAAGNLLMPGEGMADDAVRSMGKLDDAARLRPKGDYERFYHGTSADFTTPDWGRFNKEGLYGDGYYVTSDPRVAGGLVDRPSSTVNVSPDLHGDEERLLAPGYSTKGGPQPPRDLLDEVALARYDAESADAAMWKASDDISASRGESSYRWRNGLKSSPEDIAEHQRLQDALDSAQQDRISAWKVHDDLEAKANEYRMSGGNVRAVDVPKDLRMLDIDAPFPKKSAPRIAQALEREMGPGEGVNFIQTIDTLNFEPEGSDIYSLLTTMLQDTGYLPNGGWSAGSVKSTVNSILSEAGYDGITHQGGGIRAMLDPNGKEIQHQVKIIFPSAKDKIYNATSGRKGGMIVPTPQLRSPFEDDEEQR